VRTFFDDFRQLGVDGGALASDFGRLTEVARYVEETRLERLGVDALRGLD
jgi:hypothetical protein